MFDPRRGRAAKEKAGSLRMAKVTVNGAEQEFGGDGGMPLLWYLRDELQLTGSKYGCGTGLCGACTVHVNGEPVRACITAMQDVDGAEVTTIEGLHPSGDHPVQLRLLSERVEVEIAHHPPIAFSHEKVRVIHGGTAGDALGDGLIRLERGDGTAIGEVRVVLTSRGCAILTDH